MGRREKKLPLPSALERKQQGERAKKGIKSEPVKKREGGYYGNLGKWSGGIIIDEFDGFKFEVQPGAVYKFDGASGLKFFDMSQPPIKEEPKKTETENWLDQWEKDNGGTDISTSGKAEA